MYANICRYVLGMADIPDIFWDFADIPDIFFVNTRCWGAAYVADKIQSTTPPPPPPTLLGE